MEAQDPPIGAPPKGGEPDSFERCFAAGEVVFDESSDGRTLFVIQSGQIELTRQRPEGRQLVARIGPGDFFGEMSVVLGRPHSVRAVAISDAQLLEIDADTFEAMCIGQPEIGIRVIQRLASRVIDLEQRLKALGVDDLLRPVVRVIVRRAVPGPEGAAYETTLRELSSDAGLTMLETHQSLSQLLDRKLVRLLENTLLVPDVEALSAALDL